MPRDAWDRKANKLTRRYWEELCDLWLEYPLLRSTPGAPPDCELAELVPLQEELNAVIGNQPRDIAGAVNSLPENILKQGLFHLQKAAHVLNGAQIHIDTGMPSWSLSSAYHSAFCAVNGMLNLLGIGFIQAEGKAFLVDIWCDTLDTVNRKRTPAYNTRIQKTPGLPEQKNVWQVFQRILRVNPFTNEIISENWTDALLSLEKSDFSRMRNMIHYRAANWPYDDVQKFVTPQDFEFSTIDLMNGSLLDDPKHATFPVALAFMLISVGHRMLKSLVNASALLAPELEVFENWLHGDHNILYQQALSASS
jgi:hypothetical protein